MSVPTEFNIYHFGLMHEDIEVVRWVPRQGKGRPLIVLPGWGETAASYEGILEELKQLNRPIYAITHLREHQPKGSWRKHNLIQEYKADSLLEAISLLDLHGADVIAHSESMNFALEAALSEPEYFHSFIDVAPVCIRPMPNYRTAFYLTIKKLALDGWAAVNHPGRRDVYLRHTSIGIKKHFSHPLKSMLELISVGKTDVLDDLLTLSKSHQVDFILMSRDALWPVQNVQQELKGSTVTLHKLKGWHDELHYQPEKFVSLFEKILKD